MAGNIASEDIERLEREFHLAIVHATANAAIEAGELDAVEQMRQKMAEQRRLLASRTDI